MRHHPELTEKRIIALRKKLKESYYPQRIPMEAGYYKTQEPISYQEAKSKQLNEITTGKKWGKNYECAWFNFRGTIPNDFSGKEVVALIDVGGEACVYDTDGNPTQGLTNKKIEWTLTETIIKKRVHLTSEAKGGEEIELWVDAGANNILGLENVLTYESLEDGIFNQAELAVFDRQGWHLYIDYDLLAQLMLELPAKSRHRALLRYNLNQVANVYGDGMDREVISECRAILERELSKPAGASAIQVSAIGHAHIDIAWLWPLRETIRKTARTFSTALMVMEDYPDYKFGASQPQLYQFAKDNFPHLYQRLGEAVKRGQWECQGAMWVEADCNLTSGESLVRQIIYGKRFFQEEFGVEVENLWLPDVFGYSASLPQIMKKSGLKYFMSQKISWNQFNKFPFQTFYWRGIDGTEVFTHFLAPNNYRSDCSAQDLMNMERENKDVERTDHALFLYGAGDGGGGPTRIYVEKLRRTGNLEDMPRTTMEFASDFFRKAEESSRDLQVWDGELYLELHRGTLTTQARTKKFNRELEYRLREVEMWQTLLDIDNFPTETLDGCWKTLMLNQFHDIIPGTSITRVHRESEGQYRSLHQALDFLTARLFDPIAGNQDQFISIANSLSWDRDSHILLPEGWEGAVDKNGKPLKSQETSNGTMVHVRLPALSITSISRSEPQLSKKKLVDWDGRETIDSPFYEIKVDTETGFLKQIYDRKVGRQVLRQNHSANQLLIYADVPHLWDAWDVDIYYEEKEPVSPRFEGITLLENGPLEARFESRWSGKDYSIMQQMVIRIDDPVLYFETEVEWHTHQKMLRAEFPVEVMASKAAYEIQYGHVFRNTHYNTSWDLAQFEATGHKWGDISQPNYGAAVLNDCKYGYKIKDGKISLNLLRSPKTPDKEADMGAHTFTYAFYPHQGNHLEAGVIRKGYELNVKPLVVDGRVEGREKEFLTVEAENVVVEVVKKAMDSDEVVIRLYESFGQDVSTEIQFDQISSVVLSDLLEEKTEQVSILDNNRIKLHFTPFEIHTLKIRT